MKWFLVVYFFVAGEWHTAEHLNMDGWHRIEYPTAESCIQAQWQFTDVTNPKVIRASCEQHDQLTNS
jgi:hypothetical protein